MVALREVVIFSVYQGRGAFAVIRLSAILVRRRTTDLCNQPLRATFAKSSLTRREQSILFNSTVVFLPSFSLL